MLDYLFTHTSLLFLVQNLWRDEAFSYVLAMQPFIKILQLTAGDFNPPLYYILLRFWMTLWGSSEIAMRSLSFIFYLTTLYILYDTCLYVFKIPHKRTSVYFLFIIFNPFLLTYAFEARMYMMVTFFVTLSYFSLWTGRKKLYILSTVLGLYTHYFSIFIYVIQVAVEIFALWDKKRHYSFFSHLFKSIKSSFNQPHIQSDTLLPLSSYIYPAIIFLPWLIFMLLQHNFTDSSFWIIVPPIKDLFYLPFIIYTGYERVFGEYYHGSAGYNSFHWIFTLLLWTILLIPLLLYIRKILELKKAIWITKQDINNYRPQIDILLWSFFAPLTIFIISYISQPLFLPRYFIFSSTGFILLIIYCFENLAFFNKKLSLYTYISLFLSILLLLMTSSFNTLNLKYHSKRDIKSMYTEVKRLKQSNDLIYLDSELDYHLAQYYMGLHEKIYIYNKKYEDIPQYVGKVLIPATAMAHVLPTYPARAFVVYYHWYNIRSLN